MDDARRLLDDAIALRQEIHAHPEVGIDLPATQKTLLDALSGLHLPVETGHRLSSIVAVLDGGEPGPTTLLRSDMDSLEMPEDTGLPFASTVAGRMHACGHDAHMAMLVCAARLLHQRREQLRGRVIFMFQPGEEGHGGAKLMLEEGLLDKAGPVDRAFALHVVANIPSGTVTTRAGTIAASADEFSITVVGRGGHGSMPHDAIDPVPAACEIVGALQAMITRRVHVFDPAVVTVTTIRAGTAHNVIPERVELGGTIRTVSARTRELVVSAIGDVAGEVAAAHRCQAKVLVSEDGYPVTVNDELFAEKVLAIARDLFGPELVRPMPTPEMGAEDFSYVLERVPGALTLLGVAAPGNDSPAPNHSNRMMVDEPAMAAGIALHAAVALSS
ncbi:MAG: M20 metallopeptidase family protein [Acidimicrobiales bacterium]